MLDRICMGEETWVKLAIRSNGGKLLLDIQREVEL